MSTPAQVTEAHRRLAQSINGRWCSYDDGAQRIADSEAKACDQLRADKIRLDALDAILAENAHRARLGWRWNPEGPDSEFKLHLSQDGKMRSIRQALDVMLAARKEGAK